MPDTHPMQQPSTSRTDVEGFWQDCVAWAHQPTGWRDPAHERRGGGCTER